jgi:hypothetical protein
VDAVCDVRVMSIISVLLIVMFTVSTAFLSCLNTRSVSRTNECISKRDARTICEVQPHENG